MVHLSPEAEAICEKGRGSCAATPKAIHTFNSSHAKKIAFSRYLLIGRPRLE